MRFDPEQHHRRSVRLDSHDYSAGGTYFVTICTNDKQCLFGDVIDGRMRLNACGLLVEREWTRTGVLRPEVDVDLFCVMPNHLHGLLSLRPGDNISKVPTADSTAGKLRRRPRSLSSTIAQFKASTSRLIGDGKPVWQRGFYEHIVRDDDDFERIAEYIVTNPQRWREQSDP